MTAESLLIKSKSVTLLAPEGAFMWTSSGR